MIKEFLQLKTAVCKAPNCSLGKEKLQFGQGKIIIQLTTANSSAVLVFVIVFVASSAKANRFINFRHREG